MNDGSTPLDVATRIQTGCRGEETKVPASGAIHLNEGMKGAVVSLSPTKVTSDPSTSPVTDPSAATGSDSFPHGHSLVQWATAASARTVL